MKASEVIEQLTRDLEGELPTWIDEQLELKRDLRREVADLQEQLEDARREYARANKRLADLRAEFRAACYEVARENGLDLDDVEDELLKLYSEEDYQ